MHLARTRSLFILASIACALIVGAAFYLERVAGSAPCPLCHVQRALFAFIAVVSLVAALHSPQKRGWRLYSLGMLLLSLVGAAIAGRHVWLQASPPDNMASCLENLRYLLDTQPYWKVLNLILAGSASCSEITWSLFGISLPEWSLLGFAGMSLFALYYLFIEFRGFGSMDVGAPD
jgi:disulfide bond formation protein DsbB